METMTANQAQTILTEIKVHEIPEDEIQRLGQKSTRIFCEPCFIKYLEKHEAKFICHDCEKYYCKNCFKGHNPSHSFVNIYVRGEEEQEKENTIDSFLTEMMNESKEERKEKFMIEDVGVCDCVDTEHRLDLIYRYTLTYRCYITGLCGCQSNESKWWVICDYLNDCIKLFSLETNELQRYIQMNCRPFDITEIIIKYQHADLNSVSSTSGTSLTPTYKHLLAVTCPGEQQILILDLNKRPVNKDRFITMEKPCFAIVFSENRLFTVCTETADIIDVPCHVCIVSLDGDKLHEFHTNIPCPYPNLSTGVQSPYITVLNKSIYMTDPYKHNVICFNAEGNVMEELTIDGSKPVGISVDRSSNKLYVGAHGQGEIYEVDSGLRRYKLVDIKRTFLQHFLDKPSTLLFYGDKLYHSNAFCSSRVTVVGLL